MTVKTKKGQTTIDDHVAALDWLAVRHELDSYGAAVIGPLLTAKQCEAIVNDYSEAPLYRATISMVRYGFGRGEYKYYDYPLPSVIEQLRNILYPPLADIANDWNELIGVEVRYPSKHDDFKAQCHEAGQTRPTPLVLKYQAGDYNYLHQGIYGEQVFPFQVAFLLSDPSKDFTGVLFGLFDYRRAGFNHSITNFICFELVDRIARRHGPAGGRCFRVEAGWSISASRDFQSCTLVRKREHLLIFSKNTPPRDNCV